MHRYMSTLYSHPEFPEKGPKDINQELMKRVSNNPLKLLMPQHIKRYIKALWKKKANGQPVTFTDIFGMLIGETLIPEVRRLHTRTHKNRSVINRCINLKSRSSSTHLKRHHLAAVAE